MPLIYESLKLLTKNDVYDPLEDSFLLARAVEEYAFGKTIDIGTGSGIQGMVAAKKGCDVTFVDIDPDALECARANASENGVIGNFIQSDLFESVAEKYNTVIFNPPYLPSQRVGSRKNLDLALDGGRDGREVIERFLSQYGEHVLEDHTILMVESSLNKYERDLKRLGAETVGIVHNFFEDLVVLKFK